MAQYSFERLRAEYDDLWSRMIVTKTTEANQQARRILGAKSRYQAVESKTGVPWFVIGCLHMRESEGDFGTWLHNGDKMRRNGVPVRTVHVPEGRPPNPDCTWEDGADDAILFEHLDGIRDWGPARVAYAAELFNGFGYRNPSRNIPSPYLWGGTSVQKRGKFTSDRHYDPTVMDPQLGAMAVLKQIMALDSTATFADAPAAPAEPPAKAPPPPTLSPRADDGEAEVKPLTKSKTVWGGVMQWLAGVGATVAGAFQYIATPWGFAVVVFVVLALSLGAYLVIKGRLDVQKLVKHLSVDDTQGGA